jgi:hypothetical protein
LLPASPFDHGRVLGHNEATPFQSPIFARSHFRHGLFGWNAKFDPSLAVRALQLRPELSEGREPESNRGPFRASSVSSIVRFKHRSLHPQTWAAYTIPSFKTRSTNRKENYAILV